MLCLTCFCTYFYRLIYLFCKAPYVLTFSALLLDHLLSLYELVFRFFILWFVWKEPHYDFILEVTQNKKKSEPENEHNTWMSPLNAM